MICNVEPTVLLFIRPPADERGVRGRSPDAPGAPETGADP
jgi:hypothetical protein